jgi:beta-1,4-mannosyl-glycoprotein beta-1,4-N-acetylglucosaminyltransferase
MKVIDCFIFYNEIDMLKFRLKELNDCVDFFVLVECIKTHQNNDKELFFENNKHQFTEYLDKIIHIIVKDNIPTGDENAWYRENYQRRCIDIGIKKLNLNNDDIIIISDLDEIPDSNTINNIKNSNNFNGIYILEQDLYYYNLNTKYNSKSTLAKILNYGSYNGDPQSLRGNNTIPTIKNGGWHFSYFGDVKFIKNKLLNFAHREFNNEFYLNDERITKKIQNNTDLFDRNEFIINNIDIKDNNYLPKNYKDLLKYAIEEQKDV